MLGVDHDKIILLSTPFPTIQMLLKSVVIMKLCPSLEINDAILHCIDTTVLDILFVTEII